MLQLAVFTRAEALADGWTARAIRTQLTNGNWTQLTRGRYVESSWLKGASPEDRHALCAMAIGHQRNLVVQRESAACLHGLRILTVPERVRARHVSEVASEDLATAYGVRCTSIARTVIDVARFSGTESGLVVADSALAQQATDNGELLALARGLERCKGKPAAITVATEADGRAESVFETVSRYRLLQRGVPRPEPQARILRYRADFLWEQQRVIGEADGLKKYGANEQAVRAALKAERRRQRALEDAGYVFERWTWDEIWRTPDLVAARIMRRLRERGLV
jgi:very-short-patch-repair endonuclease